MLGYPSNDAYYKGYTYVGYKLTIYGHNVHMYNHYRIDTQPTYMNLIYGLSESPLTHNNTASRNWVGRKIEHIYKTQSLTWGLTLNPKSNKTTQVRKDKLRFE